MALSAGGVRMDEVLSENAQKVKEQLNALIELQSWDDEINRRRSHIEQLDDEIQAEKQSLAGQRETLEVNKQELDHLLKNRREAEVTSKEKVEQAQKLGGQLFEIKTNEAYQTLQGEIRQKKQENTWLEERILEMMVAEDEVKSKISQAENALRQGEQEVAGTQAGYQKEIQSLETEITAFEQKWETAAQKVKPEYLNQYRRLLAAKGGRAMAKIENDICMGCRLSIRAQATIELKKYRTLLYCNNCARILYSD